MKADLAQLRISAEKYYSPGTTSIFQNQSNKNIVGICGKVDYKGKSAAISNLASKIVFERVFKPHMVYFTPNSNRGGDNKILFEINRAIKNSTARFFVDRDSLTAYATDDDSGGFCAFHLADRFAALPAQ